MAAVRHDSLLALTPGPTSNLLAEDGHWSVAALPAWIELSWEDELPSGWVLLRGRLIRRGRDFSARLFVETDTANDHHDLPISLKGTLLELIHLPRGVRHLRLQPMHSTGEFELHDWRLEPVGWLKCLAYRWRRIAPVYFKLSRQQRLTLGLRGYTPIINLEHAYRLAGNTRFYAPSLFYDQWFELFGQLRPRDRQRIRQRLTRWRCRIRFEIILSDTSTQSPDALRDTLASLHSQLYRDFEIKRAGDCMARDASEDETNTWTLFIEPGMTLSEHALYWFAETIREHPSARLVYCDHDSRQTNGTPCDPVFKPDWSLELLRSTNYIGPTVIFHRDTLQQILAHQSSAGRALRWRGDPLSERSSSPASQAPMPWSDAHDLLLRVCECLQPNEIHHLAAPVWHLPATAEEERLARDDTSPFNAVQAHLNRLGVAATVNRTPRGHHRVRYALPDPSPLVSVLIPTRDALAYLRPCLESLLSRTTYGRFEVLVIDNGSVEAETLAYLDTLRTRPRVRLLRDERPFNFATLNNRAANQAQGEVLCLLNNDTEVITPDWMEVMVGHLLQPGVGVVGAKLYYSNGRVQHAGDTVGPGGCAHHLHAFLERDEPGYCDRAILAQDLSAVTAACLMTRRDLYLELGGLDEDRLPVAFNDVDYCLRAREQGWRVVWTPDAELYHHESVSRGKQEDPKKIARAARELAYMRQRWGHVMKHDPFYNLNLSYQRPDFSLSHMPAVKRPWL